MRRTMMVYPNASAWWKTDAFFNSKDVYILICSCRNVSYPTMLMFVLHWPFQGESSRFWIDATGKGPGESRWCQEFCYPCGDPSFYHCQGNQYSRSGWPLYWTDSRKSHVGYGYKRGFCRILKTQRLQFSSQSEFYLSCSRWTAQTSATTATGFQKRKFCIMLSRSHEVKWAISKWLE